MATLIKPDIEYTIILSEQEARGLRTLLHDGISYATAQKLDLSGLSAVLGDSGVQSRKDVTFFDTAQVTPRPLP